MWFHKVREKEHENEKLQCFSIQQANVCLNLYIDKEPKRNISTVQSLVYYI